MESIRNSRREEAAIRFKRRAAYLTPVKIPAQTVSPMANPNFWSLALQVNKERDQQHQGLQILLPKPASNRPCKESKGHSSRLICFAMPRLIRRKPFVERVKDYLNPGDFWLWVSEAIETSEWDSKQYAAPLAFGFHFVMLIARANIGSSGSSGGDDVFGEDYSGTGWLSAIVRNSRKQLSNLD